MSMRLTLMVNGRKLTAEAEPHTMLVDFLRNNGIKSVKRGCDTTNCGLCTVWVDEKPVLSCSYPAMRAEGKKITTIEALQEEVTEFAQFMVNEGADQCGFCSPGFNMTVLAMKRELTNPTEQEIKEYLAGNLCRCSGYASHLRALVKYLGGAKSGN